MDRTPNQQEGSFSKDLQGKPDSRDALSLINEYRQFDAEIAKEVLRMSSSRMFEMTLVPPSLTLKAENTKLFQDLLEKAGYLPNPSNDPVLSLLKEHFQEFLSGTVSSIDTSFSRPSRFIDGQTRFLDFTSRQDSRNSEERKNLVSIRIGQMDEYWVGVKGVFEEALRSSLGDSAQKISEELTRSFRVLGTVSKQVIDRLDQYYGDLSLEAKDELKKALETLIGKARGWEEEVKTLGEKVLGDEDKSGLSGESDLVQASAADETRAREETYSKVLEQQLGVDLESLLRWHEEDIQRTREELLEVGARVASAKGLGKGGTGWRPSLQEVFDLLNRYAGPWPTVEEMFKHMEEYVALAKKASSGYVFLPEEKCIVSPTPEQTRDSYPWGGYGGGCWRRRPLVGEVFLNETNYKAVTDGWLKMMAIHECYPGHHAQWVRATLDPLPETVKMGAKSIPLLEGTAHRSERLMESIYDDPVFPLFVALRRHHTSVRIKADLFIHYFRRPVEDAVQLYMTELGFDRESARGQVRYQERYPGYMTCYYYGMRKLEEIQTKDGYDDKDFTEELFSVGRISLHSFENYMALGPDDKRRFRQEFPSAIA